MKPTALLRAFLLGCSSMLFISHADATTLYWDGGTANWGATTAWSTDATNTALDPGAAPVSTDDVVFSSTSATADSIVHLNADRAANSLTFSTSYNSFLRSASTGATAWKLSLGSGGITINSGAGAVTIGQTPATYGTLTTVLSASQAWANNSSSLFTVVGPVTLGANALTLSGSGTGGSTISGAIGGTGAVTINRSGTGAVTLSGTNTFSGQLSVESGTLSISSINNASANGALGNSALAVILGGSGGQTGTLQYTGSSASSSKYFTLAAGGTGVIDVSTSGQTLALSGIIDGSGNLTKTGAGTLLLSNGLNNYGAGNANQFTGITKITGGTIKLDAYTASGAHVIGSAFGLQKSVFDTTGSGSGVGLDLTGATNVNTPWLGGLAGNVNLGSAVVAGYSNVTNVVLNPQNGVSASYSGVIANGAASTALTKIGPGTQTFTAANTYSGATTIWAGTLALGGASGSILNSAATVRGGTLSLDNSTAWTDRISDSAALSLGSLTLTSFSGAGIRTETVGATTFDVGGKVTINNIDSGNQTTLALGNVTRSAGAAIDFVGTGGTLGGGANSPNVTSTSLPANTNGILPWATVNGTQWAENNSNSVRAYSGSFVGLVGATNTQNTQVSGSLSLGSAAVANSLNLVATGSGQSLNLASNNLTLGSATSSPGAILKSGANDYTISGTGQVRAGSAGAGAELITHVDGGALTISAPLNTAILGIAKGGTGDLILSGTRAGTMSGNISIAGGYLEFQGNTTSLTGAISGAGGLKVNLNAGQVLTISNSSNSYTGKTLVTGGVLAIGSAWNAQGLPGVTTSASPTVAGGYTNIELNGGVLWFPYTLFRGLGDDPDQIQITGGTSGISSGSTTGFSLDFGRELLWGSAYFKPDVFVLNQANATAAISLSNAIDLNGSTRSIMVDHGTNGATLSGVIRTSSGTAGLTKTGIGTLTLSGANTYNGTTTVSGGALNIQNATALGTTAAGTSVASGSALQIQGGITVGAEALTVGGIGISYDGALRNISGNNTYGGLVTLASATRINSDGGTLTLSNAGTITGATFGLTVGGAGNTTIASGIGTTTGGLTKDGSGTLVLSGTNTYTGNTLVSSGTLQVTNQVSLYNNGSAAAWSKTNINVGIGATMAFNVGGAGQFTKANINTILGLADSTSNGFMTGSILGLDTTGGSVLYDSVIANPNSGTNVLGLTKLGTNTLTLDQANTYTGGTLISAGTLQIGNGGTTGALSTSSAIRNNATLTFNRTDTVTQGTDFANNISGTGNLIQNGTGGTLVLSSANTFSGTTTVSAGTLTLSNALALQNSALVTTGAGAVSLSGVTTPTFGGLSGASGNLASIITGYGSVTSLTLNPQSGSSVTYGGVIAPGGGLSLTKTGAGTQILTGANTYTGTTTVNRGTLTIGNGTTGSLNGTTGTALTFTGTGTFNVAQATGSAQGMGALTLSAGDATITSTAASASATQTVTFASLAARSAGATANFTLATNTTASANKIVLASTTNAPLNNSGSNNPGIFFGGTEYARYDTTNNRFRAVTYGTDTNAPAIVATGTTLGINDATKDVKVSGNITAQTTAAVNTLNLAATTLTLSSTAQVLSVNGILSNGGTIATTGFTQPSGGGLTTASGYIQPAVAGGELVINTAGNLTINPTIQNNTSASSLTKSGTGTLTLNAILSTYSGGTVVNAGTLNTVAGKDSNDTPFGTGSVTINPGATLALNKTYVPNTLTLNNATVTSGNSFSSTLAGSSITLIGTSTINISGGLSITGNMTGTGGFIKTGSSNVPVTGTNTYTGTTTISAGPLAFSKPAALYNGTTSSWTPENITVASGAALVVNYGGASDFNSSQVTTLVSQLTTGLAYNGLQAGSFIGFDTTNGSGSYSGTITDSSGAGGGAVGLTKIGSNALTLSGNNTFSGPVFLGGFQGTTGGTLSVSSFNSVNGGSPTMASSSLGRPTTVANGTITIGNQSSNNVPVLVYTGTGETTDRVLKFNLGGNGATIDQSGASGLLKFTSDIQNTSNGARTLTLQGSNGGAGEMAGVLIDANLSPANALSIAKSGSNTWTLSGANTYTGTTTISGGTLSINSILSVGGGASAVGAPTSVANGTIAIGSTGTAGTLVYTGSGHTTDRVINLVGTTGGATLVQSGTGLLKFTSAFTATGAGAKTLTLQGSTAGSGEIAGAIVDNSGTNKTSLTKTGAGTWSLSGTNTYTGATTVNGGTLEIASGGSIAAGSTVTVNNSGSALMINGTVNGALVANSSTTISGTGTVGGNATISGTHNPGNSPGIQTFGGNLAYTGGASVVNWELSNNTVSNLPNPNAIFDQIIVGGDLDFTDLTTLNLSFTTAGSSVLWSNSFWDTAQSWVLYDVTGTTSNFAKLTLTTLDWLDSGSNAFNTVRNGNSFSLSQVGNDVVLNYNVVPEPRAALLGGLGMLLLLRRRRNWTCSVGP